MDQELESLELKISKFLRAGVLTAGAFLLVGWVMSVVAGTAGIRAFTTYAEAPLAGEAKAALARGDWSRLLSYVGLIVLIALPFTRVVLTAVLFVRRREWVLAAVAAFVSVALVGSVILGVDL